MYTKQQIFDISCLQIIRQGYQRCVGSAGCCVYDDGAGKMCAAGPFVKDRSSPNGVINQNMDGAFVLEMTVGDEMRPLLDDLQGAHDYQLAAGASRWGTEVRRIAKTHGLSANVLWSREAFTHRPFESAEEAIKFALEVDPSLDFEGLDLGSVEEVREHVIDCWEDFEAPTYDGRVL